MGCNSAGVNAFFVLRNLKPKALPERTPQEAFVRAQFRESRGDSGELLFLDELEENAILKDLPVVEVS